MGNSLHISPGHDETGHRERDLGQKVGVELPLTVDGDHVRVLDLKYYAEHCACVLIAKIRNSLFSLRKYWSRVVSGTEQ
jgi:hypothetical protein